MGLNNQKVRNNGNNPLCTKEATFRREFTRAVVKKFFWRPNFTQARKTTVLRFTLLKVILIFFNFVDINTLSVVKILFFTY